MNQTIPSSPPVALAAVTEADLADVEKISALLSTLNDPRAGADALARHVMEIRSLAARMRSRFARLFPGRAFPEMTRQIAMLGNREFEGVLLEVLEDIVALHDTVRSRPR